MRISLAQANNVWFEIINSLSSALLISRYILGLGQRGRCCFCAACPNRKMYLEIRSADDGATTPRRA